MPGTDGAWATTRFVSPDDLRHDMHSEHRDPSAGRLDPLRGDPCDGARLFVLEGKAGLPAKPRLGRGRGRRLPMAARLLPRPATRAGPAPSATAVQGREPSSVPPRLGRRTVSERPLVARPLTAEASPRSGRVIDKAVTQPRPIECRQGPALPRPRGHPRLRRGVPRGGRARGGAGLSAAAEVPAGGASPFGAQAFIPLTDAPFLVIVCPDEEGRPGRPQAFVTTPWQGVCYARNTWHGVLTPFGQAQDFVVVDRAGAGVNLEEFTFRSRGRSPRRRRPPEASHASPFTSLAASALWRAASVRCVEGREPPSRTTIRPLMMLHATFLAARRRPKPPPDRAAPAMSRPAQGEGHDVGGHAGRKRARCRPGSAPGAAEGADLQGSRAGHRRGPERRDGARSMA